MTELTFFQPILGCFYVGWMTRLERLGLVLPQSERLVLVLPSTLGREQVRPVPNSVVPVPVRAIVLLVSVKIGENR